MRYWEQHIPSLHPLKSSTGQRLYQDADIETLVYFKYLIHNKMHTVRGALRELAEQNSADALPTIRRVRNTRRQLLKILRHLRNIEHAIDASQQFHPPDTHTVKSAHTSRPIDTSKSAHTPKPAETSKSADTPKPIDTLKPTHTSRPIDTLKSADTLKRNT